MAIENRTRITLLLPTPTALNAFFLLNDILDQLIALCGGVTTSPTTPPIYDPFISGRWFDEKTGQTVSDASVFIFSDAPISVDDPDLHEYLYLLKRACQEDFDQEIIWVTMHRVDRITGNDYIR